MNWACDFSVQHPTSSLHTTYHTYTQPLYETFSIGKYYYKCGTCDNWSYHPNMVLEGIENNGRFFPTNSRLHACRNPTESVGGTVVRMTNSHTSWKRSRRQCHQIEFVVD